MSVDPTMLAMIRDLRLPGHPDPVREILDLFEADAREVLSAIARMHAAGDLEGVRRGAHRLKGAAANLGATGLVAHLTALERAAMEAAEPATSDALAALPGLVDDTLATLQGLA